MMAFNVPSSKMQEEQSNKVVNSSNGQFSLAFVCPGLQRICHVNSQQGNLFIQHTLEEEAGSITRSRHYVRITKSAPIRGPKYRKYTQHRFVLVQPDEISTLILGGTILATTKFYQYASIGTPGELSGRRMPCFCDCCMRGTYHRRPNAAFCGP